ncbi:hypothetical protein REY75_08505 [Bacillus sp. MHSD_37]|uniref:hypothetical protein n=1 Tax=Bacillus sp. MHSD_37 TaxID=3073272 RepID=UPI002852F869|nr:hypothetical protein [Bacillus sp. MHSD_37]MDR4978606.1 hypothetical protein [Bacillus sp. MHSD_37]
MGKSASYLCCADFKGRNIFTPLVLDVTYSTGRHVPSDPAHQMIIIVVYCQ